MVEVDVESLLSKIEETIRAGKKTFMGDLRVVDDRVCLECINQIRNILPTELSDARVIAKDSARIIEDAKIEANNILNNARQQAAMLTNEDAIVNQARQQANDIVNEANYYAYNLKQQAIMEVSDMINDAEKYVSNAMSLVQNAKQQLMYSQNQNQNGNYYDNGNGGYNN